MSPPFITSAAHLVTWLISISQCALNSSCSTRKTWIRSLPLQNFPLNKCCSLDQKSSLFLFLHYTTSSAHLAGSAQIPDPRGPALLFWGQDVNPALEQRKPLQDWQLALVGPATAQSTWAHMPTISIFPGLRQGKQPSHWISSLISIFLLLCTEKREESWFASRVWSCTTHDCLPDRHFCPSAYKHVI